MNRKIVCTAALSVPLLLAGCSHPRPVVYAAPPPPPTGYAEAGQQGFGDGYRAAQRDVQRNAPPDFRRHPRFRNPPVPPPLVEDYRHGFRDGYERFLHQGPPAPPPGV